MSAQAVSPDFGSWLRAKRAEVLARDGSISWTPTVIRSDRWLSIEANIGERPSDKELLDISHELGLLADEVFAAAKRPLPEICEIQQTVILRIFAEICSHQIPDNLWQLEHLDILLMCEDKLVRLAGDLADAYTFGGYHISAG